MKVLVLCEESATVREAFKARGHDAWSCDLLPSAIPGQHYQGDALDILNDWRIIGGKPDIVVAFTPCTFSCNSGVRWLWGVNGEPIESRWENMKKMVDLFYAIWNCDVPKICMENPIPHKYAGLPKYTQIIQPWQFGHGETKATCLWLKGLPKLIPINIVPGREGRIHKMPPSDHRAKDRSKTYQGIADAFATQWSLGEEL
jgi:hypothetical protein